MAKMKNEKRKAKNEKRKAKNEKRKSKNEKRKAKNEKRKTKIKLTSPCRNYSACTRFVLSFQEDNCSL